MTTPDPASIIRPRPWQLAITPGTPLLNANRHLGVHEKAKRIKAIRNTAWALARHHKIPHLERAHILYVIHPAGTQRRRDPGNWAPSAKAAVDGLVDAGVLDDDDSTRLIGPDPRIGAPIRGANPQAQMVLWITDLDQMDPDHIALLNPPIALPGAAS